MGFWCEVDGLDELERDLPDADRALSDGTRDGVARAFDEGAQVARETRRYTDRTGTLTARTEGLVDVSTPGGATGRIVANTPYASFVDGGTAPHEIHPRGPYPLRFQVGGEWVSASMVHHPGTAPDGFMGRAYLKAERVLEREIELGVAEAQKIIER